MSQQELNIRVFQALNEKELEILEKEHRKESDATSYEAMVWAEGTPFTEIAKEIIPDKIEEWTHPFLLVITEHNSIIGAKNLCQVAAEYYAQQKQDTPLDVLSVSASMESGRLVLKTLLRIYAQSPNVTGFFDFLGEDFIKKEEEQIQVQGKVIIPDHLKNFSYTEEEIEEHQNSYEKQQQLLKCCSKEKPLLNQLDKYVPKALPKPVDYAELIYDLQTKDKELKTITKYDTFITVFRNIMTYVSGVEYYHYTNVIRGEETEEIFMKFLEAHVFDNYVTKGLLAAEDVPVMLDKLYRSLFELYIVQDLIDDPEVTDVKITGPHEVRARVKGKAYLSNISFVDREDYLRFIDSICIRNNISLRIPSQTFTDTNDDDYILRFSISAEYINSVEWPYLHIRKVPRKKLMAPDLIEKGMFNEIIRDYLLDCGRNSRGVVFAGPPGSGKTVCLNWFLEDAYEQSAEILVIQENDELFSERKGVMFQHVVNFPERDKPAVSLEQLGQLALVAGANVFIIGEVKGAEICSAITLSNSGCRTALTVHSNSSTETIDKMADLAMRGIADNIEQAKRMLKGFQTVVYLEDFKVKEITEIMGYNEEKKDVEYRYIYRREE